MQRGVATGCRLAQDGENIGGQGVPEAIAGFRVHARGGAVGAGAATRITAAILLGGTFAGGGDLGRHADGRVGFAREIDVTHLVGAEERRVRFDEDGGAFQLVA